MPQSQTFFVTGATGGQGGHVARALLASGQHINCLVRDPSSLSAQKLQSLGARLIEGDFNSIDALNEAATGCMGVFINVSPTAEASAEVTNAQNIIDAAISAGVKKCVYASVVNAGRHTTFKNWSPTGFRASYWLSKNAIQEAVQSAGFETWTILQPGLLMPDFVYPVSQWYFTTLASKHTLRVAYKPDTCLPLTDPADIGKFATKAFLSDGTEMNRKVIPVASQMSTANEMARTMTEVSGVQISADLMSEKEIEEKKGNNALVASQVWASDGWNEIQLDEVMKFGIKLNSFDEFLVREKDALMKALQA